MKKANPIRIDKDGNKNWKVRRGDVYVVTGVTTNGKRFSIKAELWANAQCINLFRGSRWLLRYGKRYLLQRVYN